MGKVELDMRKALYSWPIR